MESGFAAASSSNHRPPQDLDELLDQPCGEKPRRYRPPTRSGSSNEAPIVPAAAVDEGRPGGGHGRLARWRRSSKNDTWAARTMKLPPGALWGKVGVMGQDRTTMARMSNNIPISSTLNHEFVPRRLTADRPIGTPSISALPYERTAMLTADPWRWNDRGDTDQHHQCPGARSDPCPRGSGGSSLRGAGDTFVSTTMATLALLHGTSNGRPKSGFTRTTDERPGAAPPAAPLRRAMVAVSELPSPCAPRDR